MGRERNGRDDVRDAERDEAGNVDLGRELTVGFAAALIGRKAGQIVRQAQLPPAEREDLEQTMAARVCERFDRFDPEVAHWNVWVTTVVERHVASILKTERFRSQLPWARPVSLAELVEDDDELVELGETIAGEDRGNLTGRWTASDEELADLRMDVEEVLDGLPADLREVCELLKRMDVSGAARELGLPRTTVWSMIARLRTTFAAAGLDVHQCGFADSPTAE